MKKKDRYQRRPGSGRTNEKAAEPVSSRTGPGPPPAHYTSTAALRKFPPTSQIQTNPTVVTWQIRNLTVSGRAWLVAPPLQLPAGAGRPEPAARGRAPVEGPSLHSPTQWSPTEERRLVAEEGLYSKKTWPQKNEDGQGGRAPSQGPTPSSTSDLSDRPTSDRHPDLHPYSGRHPDFHQ